MELSHDNPWYIFSDVNILEWFQKDTKEMSILNIINILFSKNKDISNFY